jgi:hypothetical protein
MKKCLMLVRLAKEDISKMHIAELSGRFNPSAQGLDIVEMAAIFYALPDCFLNDHDGEKEQWKQSVEDSFKKMYAQRLSNSLPKNVARFRGYASEVPFFEDDDKFHSFCKASSATDDSENFLEKSNLKAISDLKLVQPKKNNVAIADKSETDATSEENKTIGSPGKLGSLDGELEKVLKMKNRNSTGKLKSTDMQKELKFALNKRNSVSTVGSGGNCSNISMQDELKNALKKRTKAE